MRIILVRRQSLPVRPGVAVVVAVVVAACPWTLVLDLEERSTTPNCIRIRKENEQKQRGGGI